MTNDGPNRQGGFDDEIEQEYLRAAAETFKRPPATPLRPTEKPKPFRWPGIDQRRDTVSIPRDELNRALAGGPRPGTIAPPSPPTRPAAAPPAPTPAPAPRPEPTRAVPIQHAAKPESQLEPVTDATEIVRRPAPTPVTLSWVLEIEDGPLVAMPARDLVVGRKPGTIPGCERLTIDDPSRTISKSHVRLTLRGGAWFVEDLDSTNGTALIDETGAETFIAAGQPVAATERLKFGTLRVRLREIQQT